MQVCIGGWKACPLLVLRAEADAKTRLQQVEPEQLTVSTLEQLPKQKWEQLLLKKAVYCTLFDDNFDMSVGAFVEAPVACRPVID